MPEVADAGFFVRLNEAGERFRGGLAGTLAQLATTAAAIDPLRPAPQLLAELRARLHALAGAAPTFGMRELGQGARALEQRLRVLMVFASVDPCDWAAWIGDVDAFVTASGGASRPA